MAQEINGNPVTEKQIQDWVDEAEAGYDVERLKKRGRGRPGRGARASQVVTIRFTAEELEIIDTRAEKLHVSRSELIREAVLSCENSSSLSP